MSGNLNLEIDSSKEKSNIFFVKKDELLRVFLFNTILSPIRLPWTFFLYRYHTFAFPFLFAEQPLILLVATDDRSGFIDKKISAASNGNILSRRRLKQIVYLSTWKYCRPFPGQIASFWPLVKTVSISFRSNLVRYSIYPLSYEKLAVGFTMCDYRVCSKPRE